MNGSGQVRSPANRAAFIEELATIMSEVTDQELTPLVRKIEVELTAVRERARAVMAERDALREQTARQREAVRQYFCECRYGDGITLGIALTRMLNAAGLDPVWPDEIPEHDRNALQIVVEHRRMEEENARLRRELDRAQAASEALARTLHEERTAAAAALRERVSLCAKEWVQMAIEDAPTPGHGEALRHCAIAVEAALANAQPGELEALRDGATDLRKWLHSDDTGLSSTAMARHLASHAGLGVCVPCKPRNTKFYPRDLDDFDRCCRLLEAVPALRPHLPAMAELSPAWAEWINVWDELEALRRVAEEVAHQLDARIKALIASIDRS